MWNWDSRCAPPKLTSFYGSAFVLFSFFSPRPALVTSKRHFCLANQKGTTYMPKPCPRSAWPADASSPSRRPSRRDALLTRTHTHTYTHPSQILAKSLISCLCVNTPLSPSKPLLRDLAKRSKVSAGMCVSVRGGCVRYSLSRSMRRV